MCFHRSVDFPLFHVVELSGLYALLLHFHVDFMVVNLREIQVSLLTRREDFISGMLCICSFGFGPTSIFTSLSLFDANTNISRPNTHTELCNIRKFYMSHGYIKCRFILHSLGRGWSYPI